MGRLILKRIAITVAIIWVVLMLVSLVTPVSKASGEEQQKYDWYFISGYNGAPTNVGDFEAVGENCSPGVIWYYNGLTENWYAWFPIFEELEWEVLSMIPYRVDWLYSSRAYWIACPNKDPAFSGIHPAPSI